MADLAQQAADQVKSVLGRLKERVRPGDGEDDRRWLVVTIDRTEAEIAPAGLLPAQLAELGSAVEVEMRPAPGQRGTELAVRALPAPEPGSAAQGDVDVSPGHLRQVLRQVKQVAEVGEVLIAEPRPEGRRPATLAGKLVDKAEQGSDRGGVL
jgi:hypothetical protein